MRVGRPPGRAEPLVTVVVSSSPLHANLIAPRLPGSDPLRMLNMPVADTVDLVLPVVVDDCDLAIVDVHPTWSLMDEVIVPTWL